MLLQNKMFAEVKSQYFYNNNICKQIEPMKRIFRRAVVT